MGQALQLSTKKAGELLRLTIAPFIISGALFVLIGRSLGAATKPEVEIHRVAAIGGRITQPRTCVQTTMIEVHPCFNG